MTAEPRDPELEAAIRELQNDAMRLRWLDRHLVWSDENGHYDRIAAMRAERDDLKGRFRSRATKLNICRDDPNIAWRALLLMVEIAWDLRARDRRMPSHRILTAAVKLAGQTAERDLIAAQAERVSAKHAEKAATWKMASLSSALTYCEDTMRLAPLEDAA